MAPGRKKGGGAVKAAPVKREWNVGELVLAKVKGYPAWPAQVGNIVTYLFVISSYRCLFWALLV
jgi:hypothetical protein